jgi:hypothetical protein
MDIPGGSRLPILVISVAVRRSIVAEFVRFWPDSEAS